MSGLQRYALLASAIVAATAGCSLQGLDDFPLGPCDTSDECRVLNRQEGVPATCRVFVCRREDGARPEDPGTCQRVAAGDEVCDGTDNDCDGIVDEASSEGAVLAPSDQVVELSTDPADFVASDGVSDERVYWASALGPTTAQLAIPEVTTSIVHRTPVMPSADTALSLIDGCWNHGAAIAPGPCLIGSLAVSPSTSGPVSAFIKVNGCPAGQLRFALSDPAAPENFIEIGDERRSNTFRGLLPASTSACSANTRQACVDAIAAEDDINNQCGVSHVDLQMNGNQGVAAFLSVGAGDACGSTEDIDVMAYGVFVRLSEGSINDRIDVSDEGTPEVIGQTHARSRPSIQVLSGDAGMLVGHTNLSGNLELTVIPPQADPPRNDGSYSSMPEPDDTMFMRGDAPVAPLTGVTNIGEVDLGGDATDAVFAIGRARGGELRGAVAWRTACSNANGNLRVMGFVLSEAGGVPTGVQSTGTISTVETAMGIGVPEVVRLGNGILVDPTGGSARMTRGGFIIAFEVASQGHVRIARLADDEDEVLTGDGVAVVPVPSNGTVNDLTLVNTGQGVGLRMATSMGVTSAAITCSPDA